MKKSGKYIEISKAAKRAIWKKYRNETIGFWISLFFVCYIEFMSKFHIPSIWDIETCSKINNIVLQLLLAFIASFIFLYINILTKELKSYEDSYPQIVRILKNMFSVFDSHERCLKTLYKDATNDDAFVYDEKKIDIIINYLKKNEKEYKKIYGDNKNDLYTPASHITGSNYLTAAQISYDIELLNNFRDILNSDFNMILFDISQNLYISKLKDYQINDLEFYRILVKSEILLHKQITNLKIHSMELFRDSI